MKEKTKPSNGVFSNIHFLFDHACCHVKRVIIYTWLTATVVVLLNLLELFVAPMVLQQIENTVSPYSLLVTIAAFTMGIFVLRAAARYLEGVFMESRDVFRVKGGTRLAEKALTASYPDAVDPSRLQLLERAAQAMGDNANAPIPHMWQTFANVLINTAGIVIYACLLLQLHWVLPLAAVVTAVAEFLIISCVSSWGHRHSDEETAHHDHVRYAVRCAESETFAKDVRVFGLMPWICDIRDSSLRALKGFLRRRNKVYVWTNIADALLAMLRNGIAYIMLIDMALSQDIAASRFLLYFTAIGGFTLWIRGFLADMQALRYESAAIDTYRAFLEHEEAFCFEGGEMPQSGRPHTIELRDVSFAYSETDAPVFHHLNITLHAGEKLAVVGLNGSGKTTLIKLLCGLYDPDEGMVLLDGNDIRLLDRRAYYTLFSAVFQEHSLLEVTVAQTVAQQTDNIDTLRVWDCLAKAGLDKYVRSLPQGLQTIVGRTACEDGVSLSGGQEQRLLLARALYKNADILLLDEPTAALDPLAEQALYQQYDRMTEGKSAVFISHRLASTRFCDRIVYIADGAVVEEGTHEELMVANKDYAALFEIQSRYYREGRDSL